MQVKASETALAIAKQLGEHFKERAEAQKALAAIESKRPEQDRYKDELRRANQAHPLEDAYCLLNEEQEDLTRVTQSWEQLSRQIALAQTEVQTAEQKLGDPEARTQALTEKSNELSRQKAHKPELRQLQESTKAHIAYADQCRVIHTRLGTNKQTSGELEKREGDSNGRDIRVG